MQKTKNYITVFCILLVSFLIYSCSRNDDAVILKELKQQNEFLSEQYKRSVLFFKARVNYQPHGKLYLDLFTAHDKLMSGFISTVSKDNFCAAAEEYRRKNNELFEHAKTSPTTRFLEDDALLLTFEADSLCSQNLSADLKIELLKQHVLKHSVIVTNIFRDCIGISADYFFMDNKIGYKLTIQESRDSVFYLHLSFTDSRQLPFPVHLEFISLNLVYIDSYYHDDLLNIKSQITRVKPKNKGVFIQTKHLKKGFYVICANKLSISEEGRLLKEPVEFRFEITENQ